MLGCVYTPKFCIVLKFNCETMTTHLRNWNKEHLKKSIFHMLVLIPVLGLKLFQSQFSVTLSLIPYDDGGETHSDIK